VYGNVVGRRCHSLADAASASPVHGVAGRAAQLLGLAAAVATDLSSRVGQGPAE